MTPYPKGEVMITWSGFVTYMLDNQRHLAPSEWIRLRDLGKARLQERYKIGRSDYALDFSDLVRSAETRIAPR